MIQSFRNRLTEKLFLGHVSKRISIDVQRSALRKLLILDAAESLEDLRSPPGNQLKKLGGDRTGQYSIRINDQWRICFVWKNKDAYNVELVDYH